MAVSIASFVLMTVAARQLTRRMPTVEILCLRSLLALIILLALWRRLGATAYATRRLDLHIARNAIHLAGQYAWVWARLLSVRASGGHELPRGGMEALGKTRAEVE